MGNTDLLNKRVDESAIISDYVYNFERYYTDALKDGEGTSEAKEDAEKSISENLPKDITLTHSHYDPDTGVAAIAVKDAQTGETYIAYAGTNIQADGMKDVASDVNIGLNDPLALKELGLDLH